MLDRIHLAYEVFSAILEEVAAFQQVYQNGLAGSREKIKDFVKDVAGKVHPETEPYFSVSRQSGEESQEAIYRLLKTKMQIRFEPVYPLKIIFTDKAMEMYNRVFLLLFQIEIARSNLLSRL